jgi:hypothetical protein
MLDKLPAPMHVLFAEASNEANHLYRSFQTSEWTLPGNALCTLTGLESPRLITRKVNRGTSDADLSDNRIYRTHQSKREGLANKLVRLQESIEKRRRFIRDADDFVRCLEIEFEIELGFRLAVIPVSKVFELAPPQWPLRKSGAFDGDANAEEFEGRLRLSSRLPRRR